MGDAAGARDDGDGGVAAGVRSAAARRGQRIRDFGRERARRAGGVRASERRFGRSRWREFPRGCSAARRGDPAGAGRESAAVRGSLLRARYAAAAALGQVRRGAPGAGGAISHMARRGGRRVGGRRRRIRHPALGHGVDGRRGPQPLRPSRGRGVPGRGIAATEPHRARASGRGAWPEDGDEGGVRLHRRDRPVGQHGRGALRARAGGARRAQPVRRGARGGSRGLATRRDVRRSRRRRGV